MKKRILRNIEVSEVGMGCMAFSHGYGKIPAEEYSIEAIQSAYDHGCTFFDTAEVYSPNLSGIGHNERIVGKALKGVRENVVIATKLMLRREASPLGHGFSFGSVYDTIRNHLEGSLERLQTDYADIYYLCDVHPDAVYSLHPSHTNHGLERRHALLFCLHCRGGSDAYRMCETVYSMPLHAKTLPRVHQFRGYVTDSPGRALEWHSRGQRFDPAYLHQYSCEWKKQNPVLDKRTGFCFIFMCVSVILRQD